jgi:hypothetical protein
LGRDPRACAEAEIRFMIAMAGLIPAVQAKPEKPPETSAQSSRRGCLELGAGASASSRRLGPLILWGPIYVFRSLRIFDGDL